MNGKEKIVKKIDKTRKTNEWEKGMNVAGAMMNKWAVD
jgi:hypothetical protein